MSDKLTYTLKKPVELKNGEGQVIERIEVLTLAPLRGEHARKIKASAPMPIAVEMLQCSANLPPSTVDKLDLGDIIAAAEVGAAAGFFGDFRLTGEKP